MHLFLISFTLCIFIKSLIDTNKQKNVTWHRYINIIYKNVVKYTHTHTHTHTQRDIHKDSERRERQDGEKEGRDKPRRTEHRTGG